VVPQTLPYAGRGQPSKPRYRQPRSSLRQLVLAAGEQTARTVTWRQGADGQRLVSRFVALRVRPAGQQLRRAARGQELPVRHLLAEWPHGEPEPVKYWLASLPADTPLARLVGLAKLRWRVEHDYRELKDALGLDHFEGRSFKGWHHHVTLVSAAHAFVTLQRLNPKAGCAGLTTFQVVRELQLLLACWAGACPLCLRRLPRSTAWLHPPTTTT
jgi:SRSO17 transposase